MSGLDAFFREIRPLLLGEVDVDSFLARVGPSSSTSRRVGVYARLVGNGLANALQALYPGVRVAVERRSPGAWRPFVADYYRANPPAHWDLNRCGAALPSWLAAERASGADVPAFLEDLADFHWTEYAAYTSAARMPPAGVNPTAEIRQYGHDVVSWGRSARRGEATAGFPLERLTTVIVYRHPATSLVHTLSPTAAALIALAREQGVARPGLAAVAARLGEPEIAAARRALVSAGVLIDPRP